ncbi:response regulator transcription factor [Viridibacillus sp. NPDC096237]|uniref:response regulator transcription factor n=1 Tax=Viridibacillus sp. NPDC096237 TaxID=3390721 RepID=UPI003D015A8E
MKRLLFIEDDQEIGSLCEEDLEERGYEVIWLQSGDQALDNMEQVNLVILDVMLPGLDGFTVGQRLKNHYPAIPILMLSARTAVEDKLHGLMFADDYVTKPFHPEELAARIEVLLRRTGQATLQELKLNHLSVYMKEQRIVNERSQEELILTAKQHAIFMYLLHHPNQILTKEQIYEAVWKEPFMEGDKTLMVHIRHLREKIESDPSTPTIIETIRGLGYRIRQ